MMIFLVIIKLIRMNSIKFSELGGLLTDARTLVMCSATWCGPCVAIRPMVEDLVDRYPDVPFLYVLTEARWNELEGEVAGTPFERVLRSFPSLFLVDGGKISEVLNVRNLQSILEEFAHGV